jgi:asparagine synthase (glutamine-hydrolysing)
MIAGRMATWAHWSAQQGLLYRYPLTDIRLLRFALGLPPELLWQRGRSRGLFQAALSGLLPRSLSKFDPSNEAKRRDQLDSPDASSANRNLQHLLAFLPLDAALRVWHLWHHYGESSPHTELRSTHSAAG